MAVDLAKLTRDLDRFYDFSGKTVLYVGAGGGQLLGPSARPKKLIAIDRDADALKQLETRLASQGRDPANLVAGSFEEVKMSGDVVYFEFCLHEIDDPYQALAHARSLAPDIVVFDHSPGSEWMFLAAEEGDVQRAAEAMERFGIRRRESFQTEQRFRTRAELLEKLSAQGPIAVGRARRFARDASIVIPMKYQLALL